MGDSREWARVEFGDAELGDVRRTKRLVELAAEVARRPSGTVTGACATSASREGAFRFLENRAVKPSAVAAAMTRGAVARCGSLRRVIVPVDATSLHFTDNVGRKSLGSVGAWDKGARGVQVMTALALEEDGKAVGVCGQRMWVRNKRSVHGDRGATGKKGAVSENALWLDVLGDVQDGFAAHAPETTPWYQLDRGGDCWQILALAEARRLTLTVRAAHDRCVDDGTKQLWATLERSKPLVATKIAISARPSRYVRQRKNGKRIHVKVPAQPARLTTVTIRAAQVSIAPPQFNRGEPNVVLNAVYVRERGRTAKDRVEWMLLTTHAIRSKKDALEVVRAYALRWRIEELHRTWKSGLCRVEDSQLASREALYKWATILVAVATRAQRLTRLARSSPDVPASSELSRHELDALIALRKPKGVKTGDPISLSLAVRWIAELGGYSGPWKGPPGAIVIGRGLYDVTVAARVIELLKSDER